MAGKRIGWQRFQLDYTVNPRSCRKIFGQGDDQEGVLFRLLQSFYELFDNVDTINMTNIAVCHCIELGRSHPCQMLAKKSLDLKLTQCDFILEILFKADSQTTK